MRKPKREELLSGEKYEPVSVYVPTFRDKETGNLYFIDVDGKVLDKYIQVVDIGGIPVAQARRSKSEKFLKLVRNVISVLDPTRKELALGVAKRLLKLSEYDVSNARAIWTALEYFDQDRHRDAAFVLIDTFGPQEMHAVLQAWVDDPGGMIRAELKEKLGKLISSST